MSSLVFLPAALCWRASKNIIIIIIIIIIIKPSTVYALLSRQDVSNESQCAV